MALPEGLRKGLPTFDSECRPTRKNGRASEDARNVHFRVPNCYGLSLLSGGHGCLRNGFEGCDAPHGHFVTLSASRRAGHPPAPYLPLLLVDLPDRKQLRENARSESPVILPSQSHAHHHPQLSVQRHYVLQAKRQSCRQ